MQLSRKILLLGTGGHCISIADSLINLSVYDEIGLVEKAGVKPENPGVKYENHGEVENNQLELKIVGNDDQLEILLEEGYTDAFIAIGSIGDTSVRRKLYHNLKRIGFHIPNIIDQSSTVSKYAVLGEGIYVGKNAVINACAAIGNGAIINTSSIIEHQCEIGEFVHIAPGSVLCGNVKVGQDSHIGAGSIIKQGIIIGKNTLVGMGSVVLKDIGDQITAYGNPCKVIYENEYN